MLRLILIFITTILAIVIAGCEKSGQPKKNSAYLDSKYDFLLTETVYEPTFGNSVQRGESIRLFDAKADCLEARDAREPLQRVVFDEILEPPLEPVMPYGMDRRGNCDKRDTRTDLDRNGLNERLTIAYAATLQERKSKIEARRKRERELFEYAECVNSDDLREFETWTGSTIETCESLPFAYNSGKNGYKCPAVLNCREVRRENVARVYKVKVRKQKGPS